MKREQPLIGLDGDASPYLYLRGIEVRIHLNSDNEPYVQIETPEDSDVWEHLTVYMNDGKAVVWE